MGVYTVVMYFHTAIVNKNKHFGCICYKLYCKLIITRVLAGVELLLSRNSKNKIRIHFLEGMCTDLPELSVDCLFNVDVESHQGNIVALNDYIVLLFAQSPSI